MVTRSRFSVRPYIGGILFLVLLFFALRRGWLAPVSSRVIRLGAPVVRVLGGTAEWPANIVISFARAGTLSRRVRELEEETTRLRGDGARLENIEAENRRLREELGLLPRAEYRLVTADVVSRSIDGVSEALIINRGSDDGIETGRPVIARGSVLIGRIQRADSRSAVIVLLTDPSFRVAATAGEKAEGLVHGARGLDIVMDTIPKTADMHSGDRVVTSGTDGTFPPHLLIGTVGEIDAPGNEIFQSARVAPAADLTTLRIVSVIRSP
jgi:rod shape-determining protein MreC